MHVHVHLAGRDGEEEDRDRVAAAHHERGVAVEHGAQQEPVAHPAPGPRPPDGHVGPHQARAGERLARRGEEARERVAARRRLDRHEVRGARAPEHLHQTLAGVGNRRKGEHLAPVVLEAEADGRARDRQPREHVHHVPDLGRRAAQELPPRRRLGEQLAHLDARARRRARRARRPRAAGVGLDGDPARGGGPARDQPHARHRGDAGQRLAAKAERGDRRQVLRARELAGRVAREGDQRVLRRHALAVVAHRDQVEPARGEAHLHVARARVERVLDQLLHYRGRPLDHLASRDLPLHRRREDRDLAHGAS